MKKTLIAFALAAVIFLPQACNSDGGEDCVYTAHTEKLATGKTTDITRAATEQWSEVNWSAGDKIKVFKASEIKAKESQGVDFTLTGSAGTPSAQFTAAGTGSYNKAKSYLIFPAALVKGHEGTLVTLDLPATQKYVPDSFSTESFAAVAVGSSKEEVGFVNLCGLLVVKIKSDSPVSIASLTLEAVGNESLCGEGTVELAYKEDEKPALKMKAPESDATRRVKLVCETPVELGAEATAFCFTLPAGVLAKGFNLYVNDNLYGQMQLLGTAGKNTVLRSTSRVANSSFNYSINAINPETTLHGMAIAYESAGSVVVPQVTGTNNGWKIYWGDGSSDDYSPLITHTYADPSDKIAVFYGFAGADQIVLSTLSGVSTVYVNSL